MGQSPGLGEDLRTPEQKEADEWKTKGPLAECDKMQAVTLKEIFVGLLVGWLVGWLGCFLFFVLFFPSSFHFACVASCRSKPWEQQSALK